MLKLTVLTLVLLTSSSLQPPKLTDLSWIAGDWQTKTGRGFVEEHWTKAAGGSMIGMSRRVVGEKTVSFEYLRIEERTDGIYYVAHPDASCPGTDFKLTRATAAEAVFENPEHDFPKRIIYRKIGHNLNASIDRGEGTKAIFFDYEAMK